MTPRRGLLVGLIFVVIAIIYWGVQYLRRLARGLVRDHDAARPGRRDVDHDLRAVRRPAAELTTPPAMIEDIWSDFVELHRPSSSSRTGGRWSA